MDVSEEFYSNILGEVRKEIEGSNGISCETRLKGLREMEGNKERDNGSGAEPSPMDLSTTHEFVCNDCGDAFRGARSSGLPTRHITCRYQVADPLSPRAKNYVCEEEGCGNNAFSTSQGLKLHKNRAHLKIKYPCWECPYQATQLGNLKRHVRRKHDKIKIKDHVCKTCGALFTTKWGLLEHDKAIHLKIRDLICKVCGDTFSRMKCLKVHVESMHGREKNPQKLKECSGQ